MEARLNMGMRERDKLHAIRNVLERRVTQGVTAKILHRSERHVRRLCARVREKGDRGIVHGLRGLPSNNRLDEEVLGQALSALHNPRWKGFGPTYAKQKLGDLCGIELGITTVRALMLLTNLWEARRRGVTHRAWRERRPCVGMLVQLDGSPHDWLEGRGPWCVLIIYIDDATSKILYGEFVHVEDTLTLMRTTKTYLERWGRPVDYYVDKDSIYVINRQAAVEEELRDEQPMTQFTRAMKELGIGVIPANSPQAKGRVERGFRTHQDRLVKELRLAEISTMDQANEFLWKVYIPDHNARYSIDPAKPVDVHKPLLSQHDLASSLSIQIQRQVQNDFTIQHRKRFYQLEAKQPLRLHRKAAITVQEHLDGSMHLVFKNQRLNFRPIEKRPSRTVEARKSIRTDSVSRMPCKPATNHPWRRYGFKPSGEVVCTAVVST
jgi:hypothetical protein